MNKFRFNVALAMKSLSSCTWWVTWGIWHYSGWRGKLSHIKWHRCVDCWNHSKKVESLEWNNKNQHEEKKEKERSLVDYVNQYKGRCSKCGEYGHKSTDPRCQKIKIKERKRKEK